MYVKLSTISYMILYHMLYDILGPTKDITCTVRYYRFTSRDYDIIYIKSYLIIYRNILYRMNSIKSFVMPSTSQHILQTGTKIQVHLCPSASITVHVVYASDSISTGGLFHWRKDTGLDHAYSLEATDNPRHPVFSWKGPAGCTALLSHVFWMVFDSLRT